MRVVSNTSPLCNLAIIGKLDFLKERYEVVWIPPTVAQELSALSHNSALASIKAAIADGWLLIESPSATPPKPSFLLDPGETEAIALALTIQADVLLIDEKRGREAARQAGLVVAGVLGELLYARQAGHLSNVRSEIERLRAEAGFFVDAKIEKHILSQVGE